MRYVFLGNNRLGLDVLRWLIERSFRPSMVVVHPADRAKFADDLITLSGLESDHVLRAPQLSESSAFERLKATKPDLMVSVGYGYMLPTAALVIPRLGAINLHIALLPYNRGAYPNVWSIIDRTPAGVTLHYMDEGIDTGDIIAQREVVVTPSETGATLYAKLETAALELFQKTWPLIVSGRAPRRPQVGPGTFHRVRDVESVDRIDPDSTVRAGRLIDILRARTFFPHRGAYLQVGPRRIQIRVELEDAGDEAEPDSAPVQHSADRDPTA